jgi:hypothetical protein
MMTSPIESSIQPTNENNRADALALCGRIAAFSYEDSRRLNQTQEKEL